MINTIKHRWIEWLGALICASVIIFDALHASGGGDRNIFMVTVFLILGFLIALTGAIIRNRKLKGMKKPHVSFRKLRQKYIVLLIALPCLLFYLTNLYFFNAILVAIAIILVIMLVDYFNMSRVKNKEFQSS